jgi:hypothetical protein
MRQDLGSHRPGNALCFFRCSFCRQAHRYHGSVFAALVPIVLSPQFYWTTKWIIINGAQNLDMLIAHDTSQITPDTWISRHYLGGPPVKIENGYLISPPKFEEIPGKTY